MIISACIKKTAQRVRQKLSEKEILKQVFQECGGQATEIKMQVSRSAIMCYPFAKNYSVKSKISQYEYKLWQYYFYHKPHSTIS